MLTKEIAILLSYKNKIYFTKKNSLMKILHTQENSSFVAKKTNKYICIYSIQNL